MRHCVLLTSRLCACILIAAIVVPAGRARAGTVVVSNSYAHAVRFYDLDAGTSMVVASTPAYLGTLATDSLAGDIYYSVVGNYGYGNYLIQYNLATGATDTIHQDNTNAHHINSMDFDPIRREVIVQWASTYGGRTGQNWIERINVDTRARVTIHSEMRYYRSEVYHNIGDIALDPFHRQVYWTDMETNSIYRKWLDGPTDIDVLFVSRPDPKSLALDIAAGAIFYSEMGDGNRVASIRRAGINGTFPVHEIVVGFESRPNQIAVDPLEQRLYWLDGSTLWACDYDGMNRGKVLHGGNPITGEGLAVLLEPGASPQSPLMPDAVDPDLGFQFNLDDAQARPPGSMFFFDPDVAIGYDYGVSGANFASVLLPSVGDGNYVLYLWNGSAFAYDQMLVGGQEHTFAPGGVDRFRIGGIEAEAELDPDDPLAFMTGLTFTGAGPLDVTMTPIIPEPASWLLLTLAMGTCLRSRRTRRIGSGLG